MAESDRRRIAQCLTDPAHLMASAKAAARGKRRRRDVAAFLLDLEPRCFDLAAALRDGAWAPGAYRSFWIEDPKRRLISAAPFADRVVHRALISLIEPWFERRFVAHSYACRLGYDPGGFSPKTSGSSRVARGGSWNNNPRNLRSANRNNNSPGDTNNNLGFRVSSAHRSEPSGLDPSGVSGAAQERGRWSWDARPKSFVRTPRS